MKFLLINSVCGVRSTGRICTDIATEYEKNGHEVKIAYGRETVPEQFEKYAVRIGTDLDNKISAIHTRVTDRHGFANKRATKAFLKWAAEYDPDVLWLHNLHGYYINIEMLFTWVKTRPNMQVKWTLHDCWAFTGHCAYFSYVNCNKWQTECGNCPQKDQYPKTSILDSSRNNFIDKEKLFTGIKNMTLITPSKWLANLVRQSFLSEYPVEVVYNRIDTAVFKHTPSDFKERYGLRGKTVVLGVASVWERRKGLDDFIKLSKSLGEEYAVVLVGVDDAQKTSLPPNVIGIKRTNSPRELAEIYTAADVFVNASREETFGLTTLEALSCGTPVVVYKETACEEVVNMFADGWGQVVDCAGGVRALVAGIENALDRSNA